jgi:hypothetical protein
LHLRETCHHVTSSPFPLRLFYPLIALN